MMGGEEEEHSGVNMGGDKKEEGIRRKRMDKDNRSKSIR